MSVFRFSSYRALLKAQASSDQNKWGGMTRLAKAAGCQPPYLSRVLAGKAQLTPSQAYGLARFWKFSPQETEYLLGLLELERAGSAEYREYWSYRLTEIKKNSENLAKVVERKTAGIDDHSIIYYSAWHWTAVHLLVSIPEFQTEKAIADHLSLPINEVRSVLQILESWGAVRKEQGRWKFGAWAHHMPKESPLANFHHANWRQRALVDAQAQKETSIHYTVVQSLSREDFDKIRELILECIKKTAKIAGPSAEETLMCFSCDLFKI